MKRILFLLAGIALYIGAYAQSGAKSVVFVSGETHLIPVVSSHDAQANLPPYIIPSTARTNMAGARTTGISGGRWYSYIRCIDANLGFIFYPFSGPSTALYWGPLWWDSTIRYRYSNGLGSNTLAGVCNTFDPIRYYEYNDPTVVDVNNNPLLDTSQIAITSDVSYTVDSISVRAAYIRSVVRSNAIVDTLFVAVAPEKNDVYYDTGGATGFPTPQPDWIHHNGGSDNPNGVNNADTNVLGPQAYYCDVAHRAVDKDNSDPNAVVTIDTILLTPAAYGHFPDLVSHPGQEYDTLSFYTFPIRGGAGNIIPAGQHFSVSISFKSGDTWTPNVDTVGAYSRFCPVFGFEGGTSPGWMTYWPDYQTSYHDFNGSSYLDARGRPDYGVRYPYTDHSGVPKKWLNEFVYQDFNNSGPGQGDPEQYVFIDAHISCNNCRTVGQVLAVNNVHNISTSLQAYPNPANDRVTISFTLVSAANVKVSLSNAFGQVVETHNIGNVTKAATTFYTSAFAAGIYFYTVEANGQRSVGKFVIAH
jgi:hypothetical protein